MEGDIEVMSEHRDMPSQQGEVIEPLGQGDVSRLTEEIVSASKEGGYLDHTIRAVEEYVISKWGKLDFYRISKKAIKGESVTRFKKGQGFVYVFRYGATIKFSPEGVGIDKRFAIAHELGHIMLHFNHGTNVGVNLSNSLYIKNPLLETQASYFAKEILNNRDDLKEEIRQGLLPLSDAMVAVYCPLYDASLLK
jgi:hypothetical protein